MSSRRKKGSTKQTKEKKQSISKSVSLLGQLRCNQSIIFWEACEEQEFIVHAFGGQKSESRVLPWSDCGTGPFLSCRGSILPAVSSQSGKDSKQSETLLQKHQHHPWSLIFTAYCLQRMSCSTPNHPNRLGFLSKICKRQIFSVLQREFDFLEV